jgi:hypothetical protein
VGQMEFDAFQDNFHGFFNLLPLARNFLRFKYLSENSAAIHLLPYRTLHRRMGRLPLNECETFAPRLRM